MRFPLLKAEKKNIPVNLITVEGNMNTNTPDISHINNINNTSVNNAVPETSVIGQYQHQLAELNLPLGPDVQVAASVPSLATCGASALPISPSNHVSSTCSAPNLSIPSTNLTVVSNNEVHHIPPYDRISPDTEYSFNNLEIVRTLSQDWQENKNAPRYSLRHYPRSSLQST